MRTVFPVNVSGMGEPEERLVQKGGGLQRMTTALTRHVGAGESAQLRLDELKQLLQGAVISLLAPRAQQAGDVPGGE